MSANSEDFKYLFDLIDDENDQSAAMAMAELLKISNPALESMLCSLQESPNPRLRRRVHQLQSAIRVRGKRLKISDKFHRAKMPLLEGLIQLHLLWFDSDTKECVMEQWNSLIDSLRKSHPQTMKQFASLMRKKGFVLPPNNCTDPESYCIGTALEDSVASDILLASICVLAAHTISKLRLNVVLVNTEFALADEAGNLILPQKDWLYVPAAENKMPFFAWTDQMILKYISSVLFTAAVSGDGFRYIYTIGKCLAGNPNDELDFLPYPYNTKSNTEEKK